MAYSYDRTAAVRTATFSVGTTHETDTWRIHRYADSIRITELRGAGKRGKRCTEISLYDSGASRMTAWESTAMGALLYGKRDVSASKMEAEMEELIGGEYATIKIEVRALRGVDVMPAGFKKIKMKTDNFTLEAEYDSFRIQDRLDKNNEPTCIPAISGGKKSIPAFYRWVQDNESKLKRMKYHEILQAMGKEGIKYHSYCAMD